MAFDPEEAADRRTIVDFVFENRLAVGFTGIHSGIDSVQMLQNHFSG